ncbi:MAG TPA: DUF2252 domain-containing protein [Gaiellaceae bacterium]|nr:DUF2252 domain-containing protein [Gaiellaceae bacterium]
MSTATGKQEDIQPLPHLTVDERVERGRAARATAPRSAQAALELAADRDPIAILEAQAESRVAELLPIRYGRMLASPFAFYRGAAAVMANDLAPLPRTDLRVQLVGDAHLANFGGYASPERNLVFDINDFDETLRGPFEWDVKRLAASVEIAGRATGFTEAERHAAVLETVTSYRTAMREFAGMNNLDVWYAHADVASIAAGLQKGRERRDVERSATHARMNSTAHDLARLTQLVDGEPRFVAKPPLIVPVEDLLEGHPGRVEHLRAIYRRYRHSLPADRRRLLESFRYAHLARKVVGVGSVGQRSWIMLLLGRDNEDALILQLKEAGPSVLEAHLGRSEYANGAERVVQGQRFAQASSDIFLGWTRVEDELGNPRDFYVRQLRDWKMSIDLETISPDGLSIYAHWCAWSLARAHARSGDRVAIAAYLGSGDGFDRAIGEFALAYAELNDRDHAALATAVSEGRLTATEGV